MECGSVHRRNFEQLQDGFLNSMDNSGTRASLNSGSIDIAVMSSAKDIALRKSKQTVVCLEVHTFTSSQNQRRRAPGSH